MKELSKVKEFNDMVSTPEAQLFLILSREIMNYRPRFRGQLTSTFILSSYGSCSFAFDIFSGVPSIGVSRGMFSIFENIKWIGAKVYSNKAGLFLNFMVTTKSGSREMSLRLAMRPARTDLIREASALNIFPIERRGSTVKTAGYGFELPIYTINSLRWESAA